MIRHSHEVSESWKNLNWKKFRKDLFRLQKRVFKAIREGNKRKALSLQKLILKSKAARFLAIRQVSTDIIKMGSGLLKIPLEKIS